MAARKPSAKKLAQAQLEARRLMRRRVIALVVVLGSVGAILWQADRALDGNIRKVQIEGELSGGEREAVMSAIAEAIKSSGVPGLHSLSLDQVQAAVSGLSWAERVSARRRWPDTLIVRLMRHSVVARWGGGGYVASNGEVITLPAANSENRMDLPLLNCKETSSVKAMEVFHILNRTLVSQGLRLVELNESVLGEWSAGVAVPGVAPQATEQTLFVALGRDDLAHRLQRFMAVRSQLLQQAKQQNEQIASVDARYHNGVAVRFSASTLETEIEEPVR